MRSVAEKRPTSERTIRDRLGEALRRSQLGLIRPLWADAPESLREVWCKRADAVVTITDELGLELIEKIETFTKRAG